MADPRKKKSSRNGPPQPNQQFHFLVSPLHLVNRRNPAAQENPQPENAGGRRSTDRDSFELYTKWWDLSPRERQVTYFTCLGYKNEQIAFYMGISVGTVKSYLKHVFYKMNVSSKVDLRLKFHGFDFERNPP
jgi:DNA-binding CsgD family transcriptional regulator